MARHFQAPQASTTLTVCKRCFAELPADLKHFPPFPRKTNGLNSYCRQCERKRARVAQAKRRLDPVEKVRVLEEKRRHSKSAKGRETKRRQSETYNHWRRQRHLDLPWLWTPELWEKCKADWEGRCAYCGATGDMTQDHFVPLMEAACPGTVPWNMIPACMICNASKQHRPASHWCKDAVRLAAIIDYLQLQVVTSPKQSLLGVTGDDAQAVHRSFGSSFRIADNAGVRKLEQSMFPVA